MPIRPQTSTAAPATSSTAAGIDPDSITAALLERVQSIFLTHLQNALPEATMTPMTGLHDDRRYQVSRAVADAREELNLEAQRFRGRRLVRRMVLAEVQTMCEELIREEIARIPGPQAAGYAKLVRRLLHTYLVREERRDALASENVARAGGPALDPPLFTAGPTPPHPTTQESS